MSSEPPTPETACRATTLDGKPCRAHGLAGDGLCRQHHPDFKEAIREAGRKGGQQTKESRRRAQVESVVLRTPDGQLDSLETMAVQVMNSDEKASVRANALARIVGEARAILETGELADENKELRKLLLDRHPELKSALRVVK